MEGSRKQLPWPDNTGEDWSLVSELADYIGPGKIYTDLLVATQPRPPPPLLLGTNHWRELREGPGLGGRLEGVRRVVIQLDSTAVTVWSQQMEKLARLGLGLLLAVSFSRYFLTFLIFLHAPIVPLMEKCNIQTASLSLYSNVDMK